MPLETATYLSQLVSTNPAATDTTGQGDDHLRLIKSALLATFPSFTAAALSSTQAQLDSAALAVNTNGVSILADAGAHFKTNTTDGITNPVAGEVDIQTAGVSRLKVNATQTEITGNGLIDGSLTVTGALNATTAGLIPVGASFQWWTDTLPSMPGVTYAWLNGQAVSRTTYAALFALIGTTYGAGDGTTTFNLPDTRDNTLVGKGTMGATTAAGRITNFVTSTLGNLFGECLHLLGVTEMPAHSHTATVTDPGHNHNLQINSGAQSTSVTVGQSTGQAPNSAGLGQATSSTLTIYPATTGVTVANANTGGGGSHNNVQPTIVCNHVMRIA